MRIWKALPERLLVHASNGQIFAETLSGMIRRTDPVIAPSASLVRLDGRGGSFISERVYIVSRHAAEHSPADGVSQNTQLLTFQCWGRLVNCRSGHRLPVCRSSSSLDRAREACLAPLDCRRRGSAPKHGMRSTFGPACREIGFGVRDRQPCNGSEGLGSPEHRDRDRTRSGTLRTPPRN
jgi:hypothetical protein